MKPLYLFIASILLLVAAGISFNWTDSDRPVLVEILGAIGISAWLPLLIIAIVWARFGNASRSSDLSVTSEVGKVSKPDSVPASEVRGESHAGADKGRLLTPLRLFLLGIAAWIAAFAVLEFGSPEASGTQIAILALSSTTGLVATFTSIVWAIFRWRFGQK
ncbi:MAG TPA: hypothetical protein VL334_23245 [Anaerolineae bacterium]|nr:hypothetical protein [Anaerolineae bacterium]